VYGWGSNFKGNLGDGTTIDRCYPVQINFNDSIRDVAACGNFGLAISTNDEIYSWGDNSYGKLGLGHNDTNSTFYLPQKINSTIQFLRIACGSDHTLAISNNGELFAWGRNQYGQLGDNTYIDKFYPVKIKIENNVIESIRAGKTHSMALANNSNLFMWGSNGFGQLGFKTSNSSVKSPSLLNISDYEQTKKIKFIEIGDDCSCLITFKFELYCWGKNSGTLGLNLNFILILLLI